MFIIAGDIEIDAANHDAAAAAALRMMEETAKEPGCTRYVFSSDLAQRGQFRLFEEWESQEALDAHFASPHMAAFQAAVGGLGVTRMALQRYEVSSVGPLR